MKRGDPLDLQSAWRDLQQRWEATASIPNGADPISGRSVFGPLSAASELLVNQIADDSGLILDPELDTLYLSLLTTQVMPQLLENVGQLWGWSTYLSARGNAIPDTELATARNRYTAWDASVQQSLSTYAKYVAKVVAHKPELSAELDTAFLARVERFRSTAYQAAIVRGAGDTESLWKDGGDVFGEVNAVQGQVCPC